MQEGLHECRPRLVCLGHWSPRTKGTCKKWQCPKTLQVDTGSPARLSCQAMARHRQQKQKKKASMHDHGRDLCVPTRLRKQLWAAHKFFQSKHACKAMGNAHHGKPAEPPTCGQLATKVHRVQAYPMYSLALCTESCIPIATSTIR